MLPGLSFADSPIAGGDAGPSTSGAPLDFRFDTGPFGIPSVGQTLATQLGPIIGVAVFGVAVFWLLRR